MKILRLVLVVVLLLGLFTVAFAPFDGAQDKPITQEAQQVLEFDVLDFFLAGAERAPIVLVLIILATYVAGQFGAQGKIQMAFALISGLFFGGGLHVAENGMPVEFTAWFWLVVYALLMGLIASLLHNYVKDLVSKVLKGLIGNVIGTEG